jgi:hypothetical protein
LKCLLLFIDDFVEKLEPAVPSEALERRGAVVDRQLGNIVFIDDKKSVYEAYHGTKEFTKDEISKVYPNTLDDFNVGWPVARVVVIVSRCALIHRLSRHTGNDNSSLLASKFFL